MCDVNEEKAAPSFKLFPDVPKYQDFRKMLDEMDKQIDAVIVSTDRKWSFICSAMWQRCFLARFWNTTSSAEPLSITLKQTDA